MLATSARKADACAAMLVGDTGSIRKDQGLQGRWRVHDFYSRMAESGDLAFPARPSASWLQAPNAGARCTRRWAYAAGFSYSLYLSSNPITGARGQGAVRWK